MKKISVAVIGLNFGQYFARIYAKHPNVKKVFIVEADKFWLDKYLRENRDENTFVCTFDEVLNNPEIDAVHICTGIPSHAEMSVAVLNAGKHCACAVPMGVTLEEIRAVVDATRKSGKNYMMMETMLYGAAYYTAKEMQNKAEFGKIQHMRGIHYQPMEYFRTNSDYWTGLPPMHYSTHAIAPLRGIAESPIKRVMCWGTGTMDEKYVKRYGNPYPIEDALLEFENGLKAEVVRGLFECAARSCEAFNIYGSQKSLMSEYCSRIIEKIYEESQYDKFAWNIKDVKWRNFYNRLPEEIQRYTLSPNLEKLDNYKDFLETGELCMHEGSHPHLVHEFVSCVVEGRKSITDEDISANITAAGVCAHISAMNDGKQIEVPVF